jgi:hypothetical protein
MMLWLLLVLRVAGLEDDGAIGHPLEIELVGQRFAEPIVDRVPVILMVFVHDLVLIEMRGGVAISIGAPTGNSRRGSGGE